MKSPLSAAMEGGATVGISFQELVRECFLGVIPAKAGIQRGACGLDSRQKHAGMTEKDSLLAPADGIFEE